MRTRCGERDALKKDMDVLENFRKDENFSPPESYTSRELATKKTCGVIVDELKSLIISLKTDTDNFKSLLICSTVISPQEIRSVSRKHLRAIPIIWTLLPTSASLSTTTRLPNTKTASARGM